MPNMRLSFELAQFENMLQSSFKYAFVQSRFVVFHSVQQWTKEHQGIRSSLWKKESESRRSSSATGVMLRSQRKGKFHCWSSAPITSEPNLRKQSLDFHPCLRLFLQTVVGGTRGTRRASTEPRRGRTRIKWRWNLGRTYHLVKKENRPPSWHSDSARSRFEPRLSTDAEESILQGGRGTHWAKSGGVGAR